MCIPLNQSFVVCEIFYVKDDRVKCVWMLYIWLLRMLYLNSEMQKFVNVMSIIIMDITKIFSNNILGV